MDILARVAEQRIREAIDRGEFDNLPLQGQPLKLDDYPGVPEHLRMGYTILRNAGVLPEEMQLKKDMVTLQQLLGACYDVEEQQTLRRRMNDKILRYNMMMEKRHGQSSSSQYHSKILRKLGV